MIFSVECVKCVVERVRTTSPTTPIAYPAASPVNPTDSPAAKCINPLWRFTSATLYRGKEYRRHNVLEQGNSLWRWSQVPSYQNSYYKGVYSDYSGHDHWDQGLCDWILAFIRTLSFPLCCTFIIRSGLKVPTPAIPMPDFAVPYAAPAPAQFGVKISS